MSAIRRFLIYLALALLAAMPAIYLRFTGWRPSPVLDAGIFGLAVLAAGFILSLPVAMSIGAGSLISLPRSARQHEEFFLTAAQSLFGISLLLRLRLALGGAAMLAGLFGVQVTLAFLFQHQPAREIATLTTLGWIYLLLAGIVFAIELPGLVRRIANDRPNSDAMP